VRDLIGVADDIYHERGKQAIARFVSAMKKLEAVKLVRGRLIGKPAAFKQIRPPKYHIWEYKSGELRFYFYLDMESELLIPITYSTKDRQKDAIREIAKKIPTIKDLLKQVSQQHPSNGNEQ